jgi:hypothetical protein
MAWDKSGQNSALWRKWTARIAVAVCAGAVSIVGVQQPAHALRDLVIVLGGYNYEIAVEWEHINNAGHFYEVFGSHQCSVSTGDIDFEKPAMEEDWPNKVSSFQNFVSCYTNHYPSTWFGGTGSGYLDGMSSMPANPGNDNTESIRYS